MGITFGMQVKVPDIQNTILFEIVFKNISSKCYDAIFFTPYSLLNAVLREILTIANVVFC